ncbi:MAG: hypothetical protein N3E37_05010 [Candidatus Micrarchaeota archaeon]|nr:hypothetical protein [Candidatus Micrarchaeota archaeon]
MRFNYQPRFGSCSVSLDEDELLYINKNARGIRGTVAASTYHIKFIYKRDLLPDKSIEDRIMGKIAKILKHRLLAEKDYSIILNQDYTIHKELEQVRDELEIEYSFYIIQNKDNYSEVAKTNV